MSLNENFMVHMRYNKTIQLKTVQFHAKFVPYAHYFLYEKDSIKTTVKNLWFLSLEIYRTDFYGISSS